MIGVRVPFLDLGRQVAALRSEIDATVGRVLDGGRFVLGPEVEAFERDWAAWCGAGEAVGVANGTDAIAIALRAVGVERGDEVITVSHTCVPTVAGIEAAGAVPVLVDVDEETFTLDPDLVEEAIGKRTRAIVLVHLYGRCAAVEPLLALARRHDLKVVEDASQAHGAEIGGRRAGSLADAAAFSFYPTKNLGALGDGGAVTTSDPEVAERARLLRMYGERERYLSVLRGGNSRLDTLQAALLHTKLEHLELWTARREEIAATYRRELAGCGVLLPGAPEDGRHANHLFVVRTPRRDAFRAALASRGVETLVHYPRPVHLQPAYTGLRQGPSGLARTERLCAEVVSLPLYPELREEEVAAVVTAVREAAGC